MGFSLVSPPNKISSPIRVPNKQQSSVVALRMGLFDGITKAFSNEDFKGQDQRVRASHILIKGSEIDVSLSKIKTLMAEINDRTSEDEQQLGPVFADLARSNSQCSSSTQGGDLGLFAPGVMAREFDDALFPSDPAAPAPPAGSLIGPVVTDFGMHLILVTQREENKNQVEEKLARIDPDAA